MVYVSSDWHGVPLRNIQKLLAQAPFSDEDYLFVLGDVIDRGEHGIALLKWLMLQPNILLLRGNHEDMLLDCDFLFLEITEENINQLTDDDYAALEDWKDNGAQPTLEALLRESPESRADIVAFLRECPLYDTVSVGGQDYVLVHGGLGNYADGKRLDDYLPYEMVWERPDYEDTYSDHFITIIGHTPTIYYGSEYRGRMMKTKTWWDIDTGAAGGHLQPMLLCLDDLREYYIDEE